MLQETEQFFSAFCPFGYLDVECAIKNGTEAGKSIDEITDIIKQYAEDCGVPLEKVDCVATVFEGLYQEARSEIQTATGKDICNNEPYDRINIERNYFATSIDGRDEDRTALQVLIDTLENRSLVVEWLYKKL